jgi:acyl carrier protein
MLDRPGFCPSQKITEIVKLILAKHSVNRQVLPEDDLRESGLTSLDMVNLMLTVEAEFDLMIPENRMTPANFKSVAAIETLVIDLVQAK